MDNYDYYYTADGDKKPVKMYINYSDTKKAETLGFNTDYDLTVIDLGPFEIEDYYQFISIVDSFSLHINFIHKLDSNVPTSSSCFDWLIIQNYKFTLHGVVTASLKFERKTCQAEESIF